MKKTSTKSNNTLLSLLGNGPTGSNKVISETLKDTAKRNKSKYNEWTKVLSGYEKLGQLIAQAIIDKPVDSSVAKPIKGKKALDNIPQKLEDTVVSNNTATNMAKTGRAFRSSGDETKAVGAVNRIYNLLKNANDKKILSNEISHNFDKENKTEDERRHKEFLNALKSMGLSGAKESPTAESGDKENSMTSSLLDFVGSLGGASAAKTILRSLAGFLTSPLGIALMGITTFAALAIMLSGYLTDLVKQKMPDLSMPTADEASAVLKNGSRGDIMDKAEKITKTKPNSFEEAVSTLENYIKESPEKAGPLLDEYAKAAKDVKDLESKKENALKKPNNQEELAQINEELGQAKIYLDEVEAKVSAAGGASKLEKEKEQGKIAIPEMETRRYTQEDTGPKYLSPSIPGTGAQAKKREALREKEKAMGYIERPEAGQSESATGASTTPTTPSTTATPVSSTSSADSLRSEDFGSERDYATAYAAKKNMENVDKLKSDMSAALAAPTTPTTASALTPESSGEIGKLAANLTNENNQMKLQENINAGTPMVMNNTTQSQTSKTKKPSVNSPIYVRVDEMTINQTVKKLVRAV